MANVKFSELPILSNLTDTTIIPVVANNNNLVVTGAALKAYIAVNTPPFTFGVAGDDSTTRIINNQETIKFIGAGGITTASDAEGAITITQGTAVAGTLTGTELNATVVTSSLTSVGILTDLTVTNIITGFAATATTSSTASSLGYLGLPQSATATTATLAISDVGKHIYVTTTGQTITIPANSAVAYPIGTAISFVAGPSATTVLIAVTSDTMYLAGTGTTGTRTLAAHGMATAIKVAATVWYINGTGLT